MEQALSLVKGGEALPSVEALAKRLQRAAIEQKPLRVKLGLDPTRPDLHLGHSVVLKKLRAFQDLGHHAILIIGDATALIGDPSGKNETRPPLSAAEIAVNAQTYLDQAGKIIDVRKATLARNSDWLSPMTLADLLRLAARATVAQILERDDFSKRYADGRPIYLHELFYPLMQGYDSTQVDADVELGGSDQRFNNLMGRELQSADGKPDPQIVVLAPLLEGTDGKIKMSKSYPEHCINLTDSPEDFYGKLMSIPDEMIARYELLLTPMSEAQIAQQVEMMQRPADQGGVNPRDVKATLAKWLVSQYFSIEEADSVEQAFIRRFRHKEIPDAMPEVSAPADTDLSLSALMTEHGISPSRSEARRLIVGGGVRLDGEKVSDPDLAICRAAGDCLTLQVGKRRFLRLRFDAATG
ncbi:MAG: tyrosine--tRNA ligase [Vampirovibrionales bacterium]|nr:tyrosine--tRNA ligase [Vampirovibrionales bacterium]